MTGDTVIHRVQYTKNGWKLRFGKEGTASFPIVTVTVDATIPLGDALVKGAKTANQYFEVMSKFNGNTRF